MSNIGSLLVKTGSALACVAGAMVLANIAVWITEGVLWWPWVILTWILITAFIFSVSGWLLFWLGRRGNS